MVARGRIIPHRAPPYEELNIRHEFAHLLLGKSIQTAATRAALLTPVCTKSFVGWGFAADGPDPTGGAYNAPADTLPGFKGPYF